MEDSCRAGGTEHQPQWGSGNPSADFSKLWRRHSKGKMLLPGVTREDKTQPWLFQYYLWLLVVPPALCSSAGVCWVCICKWQRPLTWHEIGLEGEGRQLFRLTLSCQILHVLSLHIGPSATHSKLWMILNLTGLSRVVCYVILLSSEVTASDFISVQLNLVLSNFVKLLFISSPQKVHLASSTAGHLCNFSLLPPPCSLTSPVCSASTSCNLAFQSQLHPKRFSCRCCVLSFLVLCCVWNWMAVLPLPSLLPV